MSYFATLWSRLLTYGKVYLPELQKTPMEEILNHLRPTGAVNIRKLYRDPEKQHIPMYVVTFVGPAPKKVALGYLIKEITTYYPVPNHCRRCWRFGHKKQNCRGKPICSYCSSTSHTRGNCSEDTPKCINCKGQHESCSKSCPKYVLEEKICTLTATKGISFAEAREIHNEIAAQPEDVEIPSPFNLSTTNFPPIRIEPTNRLPSQSTASNQNQSPQTSPNTDSVRQPSSSVPKTNPPKGATSKELPQLPKTNKPFPNEHVTYQEQPMKPNYNYWKQPKEADIDIQQQPQLTEEEPTLGSTLKELIPHIISLLFSPDLPTKIRSMTEIGRVLKLDQIVNKALESLKIGQTTSTNLGMASLH